MGTKVGFQIRNFNVSLSPCHKKLEWVGPGDNTPCIDWLFQFVKKKEEKKKKKIHMTGDTKYMTGDRW